MAALPKGGDFAGFRQKLTWINFALAIHSHKLLSLGIYATAGDMT